MTAACVTHQCVGKPQIGMGGPVVKQVLAQQCAAYHIVCTAWCSKLAPGIPGSLQFTDAYTASLLRTVL
jgi:hypothetical protein